MVIILLSGGDVYFLRKDNLKDYVGGAFADELELAIDAFQVS